MPDFGTAERNILSLFEIGKSVEFENALWNIEKVGKPTCQSGEPKTDVYVLLGNGTASKEIKISYKKENADFLENKINAERAEAIFGEGWENIIESSTKSISSNFSRRKLIFKEKFGRVEKGAITLGWKFEFVNKLSGDLSSRLNLNRKQIYDVYAGTNLSVDKKNANVNGEVIQNSGVANYILVADNVYDAKDVLSKMVTIDEYILTHPDIYFACKALNYRTFENKYDGDRPLAVQVNWEVSNNKLTASIVYCCPLMKNGKAMATQLLKCLSQLQVKTTDDINGKNAHEENICQ